MKVKKIAFVIILTLLSLLLISTFNEVNAAIASPAKYLNITMLRESGFGYEALDKAVWEIVEVNSSGGSADHSATIYCLKGGPGFGSREFGTGSAQHRPYSQYFDLKDYNSISSIYRSALPSGDDYTALIWLLEHAYIAPANRSEEAQAEEYRNQLLDAAGVNNGYLTDDDIDVVQQLAVWHFTNNDGYDAGDSLPELWVNEVAGTDGNYNPLTDEEGEGGEYGWDRQYDAEDLYDYLITEAEKAAASGYEPETASLPYELANTNITLREEGSNYIIGPFRIDQLSETTSTLSATIKNGSQTINPTLQSASGSRFSNIQDTIDQNFYIVLPKTTTLNTITLEISGSYYETKLEYWSVANAPSDDQPVVIITREPVTYRDDISYTPTEEPPPEEPDNFDLALRKFITSIEGVSPNPSRVPQISSDTLTDLRNGTTTTAEKIHPKNALVVETGDTVIYTIRVYNEGEIDGIVTEITDYLPEGLELKAGSSINTKYAWKASGDGRTVTTDYLDGTVLDAFNGTTLDYADVQIECTVTASTTQDNVNLKNVAEITGATDSEGTPQDDIDSTPNNVRQPYGDESQEDDDDFEDLVILGQYFDLALRKFITQVNTTELIDSDGNYLRVPVVDLAPLLNGSSTTATYNHPKQPVQVAVGDEIIYTLRVYNEGQLAGYVYEITDYLPENLEFVNDAFNAQYGWKYDSNNRIVYTDITSPDTALSANRDIIYADRTDGSDKVLLQAFDGENLDYIDVKIKVKVKDTALPEEKLTNIAEITEIRDENKQPIDDRDSNEDDVTIPTDDTLPNYKDDEINRGDEYIPGQQDDDDFEKVIIQKFDLALRKFITGVNNVVIDDREPVFHNNNGEYTYEHTKEPVEVASGDTVIYTLRIYNEGDIAGYANEVKDDVPEGLEFLPEHSVNTEYRWVMYDANGNVTENVEEAVEIRTDYLSKAQEDETGRDNLIDAFDPDTMTQPDYKDLKIAFKVTVPNTYNSIITNTAEITDDSNEDGEPVDDIDSTPDNDDEDEDDIDKEHVKVTYFDLALRKFITGVNDEQISNRVPIFSIKDGKYTYEHTKEPVEVATDDVVIYTIRIYNEGTKAGYAEEVKDDLPEGLEFLPEHNVNTEYRWVMYNANGNVTENVEEAVSIRTDYLSKAQEDETGRDNLIDAFDPDTMTQPDYKDVKIAFKVIEPNTSDRVLINTAEVSDDSDDDVDSTPDNDDEDEDDIDKEYVKVTYFDLALKKIISKLTMILDGKTYVEETGHTFEDNPEEIVKIELGSKQIENATFKFTYQIRITNEGNKAGYAYEIKDYIPEGLKFFEEDNEGWVLNSDGTVTTDQLKDVLLEPGESTTIEITLRWINGSDNLGVKTNWAEISEDSDDDIDSTPDNNVPGEDDIDDASIVLSIVTGVAGHNLGVIAGVVALLGTGIILIKKFVL